MNTPSNRMVFRLTGQLDSPDYREWMVQHATKLSVAFDINTQTPQAIQVTATGAPEMLEAFALACSLGPKTVFVDKLVMDEVTND